MTNMERYARGARPKPFWASFVKSEVPRGDSSRTPLAAQVCGTDHWKADLRSKDSRAVWRGAVGKVPVKVTRWQPTLRHARFCSRGEESDFLIDCNRTAQPLRGFAAGELGVCAVHVVLLGGESPLSR